MISRVNGSGWSILDRLTSAQMNAVDLNVTNALDKRSGQTDTLQSVVTCSNGGRVIPRTTDGTDADATFTAANSVIVVPPSLTAQRTWQLLNTGASADDRITIIGNTSGDIVVTNAVATSIAIVGSSGVTWAEFRFDGTQWVLLRSGPPTASVPGLALAMAQHYLTQ